MLAKSPIHQKLHAMFEMKERVGLGWFIFFGLMLIHTMARMEGRDGSKESVLVA